MYYASPGAQTLVVEYKFDPGHTLVQDGGNTNLTEVLPPTNSSLTVGETRVNVTYNEGGPGESTCYFLVTITEITSPNCTDIEVESGPGMTMVNATWPEAPALDSATVPVLYTPVNGSSFTLGDNTITAYRMGFPDANCTFTLRVVEDNTPPDFSTVYDVLSFDNSEVPNWLLSATDNSGEVTITSSPSPGTYFPLGNTSVTVTATDGAGNSRVQNFTVQVLSDGSPELPASGTGSCPGDQVHQVRRNQLPVTQQSWDEPQLVNDTGVTTTRDPQGNVFNEGTTKVTYRFVDAAGRTSRCFFKVKVIVTADNAPPELVSCPMDITVNRTAGTMETAITWDEPVFNDAVSGADLEIRQTKMSGSNFTEGSTQVTYSALDGNYNGVQCMFTVTVNVVEDLNKPVIVSCPQDFIHWVPVGVTTVVVSWTPANFTDESSFTVALIPDNQPPGSVFTVGTNTTITYVATDIVNNVAECSFVVSVLEDSVNPVVTCPPDITRFVRAGTPSTQEVTWPTPNATDNAGGVTVTSQPPSGTLFIVSVAGQNDLVTVTAMDENGNSDTCTFVVNVRYDIAPVLTCPNINQPTDTGLPTATVTWPNVVITDDYTSVSALINNTIPPGLGSMIADMRYDADSMTVTLTAEDERGNIGMCSFTVDVVDQEKPVWSGCPSDQTRNADTGMNSAVVSWTLPTVADNSGKVPAQSNNPPSAQRFNEGTRPVVYTAIDDSGNVGTCEFNVTVVADGDGPVFQNCPTSPVTVNSEANVNDALVNWGDITASDDAGAVTVTSSHANNQRFTIGSYDIEYQATDINGNVEYCRFTVTVNDVESPGISTCPNPFDVAIINSQQDVIVTWETPTFLDNSVQGPQPATLVTGQSPPGTRFPAGSYSIEYTARDAAGNVSPAQCFIRFNVSVVTDTITLDGDLNLDIVGGINGRFVATDARVNTLRDNLDDLFRISSSLAPNFAGIEILTPREFDTDNNFRIIFRLHLTNPSYYNEEEIKTAFYSTLTNDVQFANNNIVPGSFNLRVKEFRGQIVLARITAAIPADLSAVFSTCCSNPTSSQYTDLEMRINPALRLIFNGLAAFKMVKSLRYTQGSIVVPFTITLDDDSAATTAQADADFNAALNTNTRELMPNGQTTDLYLTTQTSDVLPITEVCPAGFSCSNGGTCSVLNSTYVYNHGCSCPSGTYGINCESTGIVLSTEAIIGIVAGVVAFLIILLLLCCCCFFFLSGPRNYTRDEEYGRKAAPLMLMPRDDYIYRRPPIMDRPGPIITEVEEGHEGPYFMHESEDYKDYKDYRAPQPPPPLDYRVPPPAPLVIEPAPRIPRPVTLGPSFQHEVQGYNPHSRRERSRRNRFRNMLPDRLPRARRRDDFGPRFSGDNERVEDMKHRLFREFNY